MKKTSQYLQFSPGQWGIRPCTRFALSALTLLSLLWLGVTAQAQPQTVSVDFVGGYGGNQPANMAPTDVAGVLPVANWNNAEGAAGTLATLVDSAGAATPLSATWNSPNTWANGVADGPGDNTMMHGYLDTGGNGSAPTTVVVSGLVASATYSVYVYVAPDSGGKSGQYSIGGQTFYLAEIGGFNGTYIQGTSTSAAAPASGNYMIFTVTGQTGFTLSATPDAVAGGGFRAPMNGMQIFKVVVAPTAPTGLVATPADSTVYLSWNAVAGASTYNVKRSLTAGGPYTTIATGIVPSTYTDGGLTNGTKYYYVVNAVNQNGTSGNSNEANATPKPAVTGTGTISVNFVGGGGTTVPVPMDPTEIAGAAPAANWNNALGTGGTLTPLLDSAGATTSTSILWGGSPNTWSSAAVDAPGDTRLMEGYLDTGNATTTSVTVSGLSPSKYYLLYAYASGDANGRPGLYSVGTQTYALTTGIFGGTFIKGVSTDPANPTAGNYVVFTVTGQPSYTLTATPDLVVNGFRAPLNGVQVIVLTAPTAPTNLTATGLDKSAYLSWTGVSVASSYNVKRSLTHNGPYTTVATGVTGTTYTDTGLTNGTKYYYVVSATNILGTGPDSNEASATPIAAVVGAGNGLYGVYYTPGTGDFSAEANTPLFSNVVPLINFNQGNAGVAYNPLPWPAGIPGAEFTAVWSGKFTAPYTGPYTFQTITDDGARLTVNGTILFDDELGHGPLANTGAPITLSAGTAYDIKFEYTQQGGGRTAQLLYAPLNTAFQIIPQSQLSTAFTVGPDAPTNLVAVGHDKSVQLYWNGGLNTASYTVKRSTTPGGPYTNVATGVAAPFYLDSGLTNGVTYYYIVVAVNNIGTSSPSNEASAKTVALISVVAYWRFEEGAAGSTVPLAPFQVPDSGPTHKNTLQTPDDGATPIYSLLNPGATTNPAAANTRSLDFSAAPANGDVARYLDTTGATGDINNHDFSRGFTVEASINVKSVATTQTFVGKDGFFIQNNDANSTLYLQLNTGVISVRAHQADQTFVICDGTTTILPNQWYNVAAVSDGFALALYLQTTPGGTYNLENIVPFIGAISDQGLPFSVGRGFYNNVQADPVNGFIDEVRISDNALVPSQFLFASSGGATITGKIALEGVNDLTALSAGAPLGTFHVSFRTVGTTTEVFGKDVTLTPIGAGNPNGTFSISGVPAGTYDIAIKGNKSLRVALGTFMVGTGTLTLPDVILPAGDATNDNHSDIGDFGIMVNAYETTFDPNDPGNGYDAKADFNYDGRVNIGDFGLLVNEFGVDGAP